MCLCYMIWNIIDFNIKEFESIKVWKLFLDIKWGIIKVVEYVILGENKNFDIFIYILLKVFCEEIEEFYFR